MRKRQRKERNMIRRERDTHSKMMWKLHEMLIKNGVLVYYHITRKCMNHTDTAYLKVPLNALRKVSFRHIYHFLHILEIFQSMLKSFKTSFSVTK